MCKIKYYLKFIIIYDIINIIIELKAVEREYDNYLEKKNTAYNKYRKSTSIELQ
jgi:hypothetical protein